MVIVAGLHLLQVTVYGAYKKPREVNWLVGAFMLAAFDLLAFALTGYLLPWDQKGYWATKVATGIKCGGTLAVIGNFRLEALRPGRQRVRQPHVDLRFFSIHVFILPSLIILAMLVAHIALFPEARRHPPLGARPTRSSTPRPSRSGQTSSSWTWSRSPSVSR